MLRETSKKYLKNIENLANNKFSYKALPKRAELAIDAQPLTKY